MRLGVVKSEGREEDSVGRMAEEREERRKRVLSMS